MQHSRARMQDKGQCGRTYRRSLYCSCLSARWEKEVLWMEGRASGEAMGRKEMCLGSLPGSV